MGEISYGFAVFVDFYAVFQILADPPNPSLKVNQVVLVSPFLKLINIGVHYISFSCVSPVPSKSDITAHTMQFAGRSLQFKFNIFFVIVVFQL